MNNLTPEDVYFTKNGHTQVAKAFVNTILNNSKEGGGLISVMDPDNRIIAELNFLLKDGKLTLQGLPTRAYQAVDDAMAHPQDSTFVAYRVLLPVVGGLDIEARAYRIGNHEIRPMQPADHASIVHTSWSNHPITSLKTVHPTRFDDNGEGSIPLVEYTVGNVYPDHYYRREAEDITQEYHAELNRDTKIGLTLATVAFAGVVGIAGYLANKNRR